MGAYMEEEALARVNLWSVLGQHSDGSSCEGGGGAFISTKKGQLEKRDYLIFKSSSEYRQIL
jgi:hypothetical protein